MARLKVALATWFPEDPAEPRGGVEAVSVTLARALSELDELDVHVVTTARNCQSFSAMPWEKATVHRLPWAGGKMLFHAIGPGRRQMRKYLAELAPDVIHAHDTFGLTVKGMPVPRVFTIHGFIYVDTLLGGGWLARTRSWIWRRVETAGWADQPHIISISPYVTQRLKGIARGVIYDIDNPINPAFFDVQRQERPGTIFSAARIGPLKNTLALVEAFASIADGRGEARLRLAGAESEPYAARVRERIRTCGLADRVSLLGRVSSDLVQEELSRASLFALVSLQENSPMGIGEAMAAGVPVVASNRCGIPYMVRDGESGFLVDPLDPEQIARRLGELLDDDALRVRMGHSGRDIAEDRFHPRRVAGRTRQVYLQAVQNHGQRKRAGVA